MTNNSAMIMDLVKKFLEDNHCEDIVDAWMEKNEEVDKIVKKATKKTSKGSSPKDPNKPKRGRSSYIFFCSDKRTEIKESMTGDPKPADVMREMGARWRGLKESSKKSDMSDVKRYEEMAAQDKTRFAQEMETYVPMSDEEIAGLKPAKKGRKKSTTKDTTKPKRSRSAYIFFGMEMRSVLKEENPDVDSKQITSLLGELWSRYKEEEEFAEDMERFKEMASNDKERYNTEIENHTEIETHTEPTTEPTTEPKIVKKKKSRKEKIVVEDDDIEEVLKEVLEEEAVEEEVVEVEEVEEVEEEEEAPKQKKSSKKSVKKNQAYINYCKAMRQDFKDENPDETSLEITKMMGRAWKDMEESEKNEWN